MRKLAILLIIGSLQAQELKRPTVDATGTGAGCSGVALTGGSIPLAHDSAGASTFSTMFAGSGYVLPHNLGEGSRTQSFSKRLTTWTTTGNSYLSLTLNILSSSPGADGTGGNACLAYSVNSGTNWTSIRCSSTAWTMVTDSVTLTSTLDLTKLQVAACVQANGNDPVNPSSNSMKIYDVWTLGTNTPQGGGNGSTAGQPHRGLVIAN